MKTISDYTIPCTEAQTKRVLELGALIEFEQTIVHDWSTGKPVPYPKIATDKDGEPILIKPTAEQMIGFLEGLEEIQEFDISIWEDPVWAFIVHLKDKPAIVGKKTYNSRREATLAAIDAALEYLTNNKK